MPKTFQKIANYFARENRVLVLTLAFLVAFSVGTYVFAVYDPGDTNDPTCAPGDAGCYVQIFPDQSGHAGQVLTTDGSDVSWTAGSGSVTSFSAGDLSPLFTTSEATATSTPALSFTLSNAAAYTILGNNSGSSAAPAYFTPTLASALFANQGTATTVLHGNASGSPSWSAVSLTADITGTLAAANGGTGLSAYGSANQILGMDTGGTALEYKTVGGDLTLSGSTFTIANNAVTTAKIADNNVTFAKLPTVSSGILLGSSSAGTAVTSITVGSGLSLSGTTLTATVISSIGTIDSVSKSANGLTLSSATLYAQTADATYPGLVSTGTQTFAGAKTFNGAITASGGLAAGGNVISGVATPSASTDAANKAYVDGLISGLKWKVSVDAATTSAFAVAYTYDNGTAGVGAYIEKTTNGALPTIDGVTLTVGQRLLVKDETAGNAPYNGIYTVTTVGDGSTKFKLTRCTSCDEPTEFTNAAVAVLAGTVNAATAWTQNNTVTTIGTDPVSWVQFLSNAYTEGAGIDITGNTISVDFSTVTGTLGTAHGGTGLTSIGSGSTLLGVDSGGTALEYKTVGGDLTLSGSTFTIANNAVTTAKIADNNVTFAKLPTVSSGILLGSSSAGTAVTSITVGSGLSLSGTTLTATGGGGSGTVTSFSAGDLSPLFTTSEATVTTTPALTFSLSNAAAYRVFGNNSGSSAAPAYFDLDLASGFFANEGTSGQVLHGNASGNPTWSAVSLTADVSGTLPIANGGTGQTTAVAAFDALSGMSASGDLVIGGTSGTRSVLARGTAGQCLVVSGTTLVWGSCSASGGASAVGTINSVTKSANGLVISGATIYAQTADATYPGMVSTGTQTIAGAKTFSSDIIIQSGGITAGYGAGSVATNTVFGVEAGRAQTGSSEYNTWMGYNAGYYNTSGIRNVGIGFNAGNSISSGAYNIAIGELAMSGAGGGGATQIENIVIGAAAGTAMGAANYNTIIGTAVNGITTGSRNLVLSVYNTSAYGGDALTSGSGNVYIGGWNLTGASGTDSNRVAISDGSGNLKMYSDSTGTNFGGDLTPNALLSVGATSQFQVNTSGAITTSGGITFSGLSSAAATGYVCITTATGVLSYHATACGVSSERFKHDISPLSGNLEKVLALRPVGYVSDIDNTNQVGFLAEEIHTIEPRLNTYDEDGTIHGVNYAQFAPLLAGAIQELNLKIESLPKAGSLDGSSVITIIAQFFQDTAISIKNLAVETLHIGSREKPAGITLYDTATGEPYCLTITSGQPTSTAGECGTTTSAPSGESSGGDTESEEDSSTDTVVTDGDGDAGSGDETSDNTTPTDSGDAVDTPPVPDESESETPPPTEEPVTPTPPSEEAPASE